MAENKRVVEPEVCFTMDEACRRADGDYTVDEVMAAVAHVCAAIEVVNPRAPRGFGDEVPWFIVDGGLNEGIVLGEAQEAAVRAQYAALRGQVRWNGRDMQGGVGAECAGRRRPGADLARQSPERPWARAQGRRYHHHRRDHGVLLRRTG